MNREQLEHDIRAACEISGDNELYIFGFQAILGQYPDADEQLRQSIEVDLSPKNKPETIDKIDGALGENSPFHQTHNFSSMAYRLRQLLCRMVGKNEQQKSRITWMPTRSVGLWKRTICQPANSLPSGIKIGPL